MKHTYKPPITINKVSQVGKPGPCGLDGHVSTILCKVFLVTSQGKYL